jgi:hypothetical protein
MTEENKPADPTEALKERISELDGLIDQLNSLTDQLHDQFKPDSQFKPESPATPDSPTQ